MIPPPPPDRALPALPRALDPAAMADLLGVPACRPTYVRYKPETNCVVQYRLTLPDGSEAIAHAKLYAGGRAAKVAARGGGEHLPGIGAVLQRYPHDTAIPDLAFAASPEGAARVVARLRAGEADEAGAPGAPELVRYKPGRKALLRSGRVYAKLYAHGRGGIILRAGRALKAARVPVAPALGYLPDLRLLAHEQAPGTPLHALRGTAQFAAGARAAGAALARVHAIGPVAGPPRNDWTREGIALTAAARAIGTLRPDLAAEAAALAERAIEGLAALPPETTTIHGDFYDDQVLVAGDEATILDLDGIAVGHPILDLGNFVAHLRVRDETSAGADETGVEVVGGAHDGDLADRGAAAFLAGYGRSVSPEALAAAEGAALLKLAVGPFRRLEADWPEGVERRLRLAAATLAPAPRTRRIDPALPQLALLRDPDLVTPVLADALGKPVRVESATVVRHKQGRRALLRYDVTVDGEPRTLYGKTFASGRGPRVYSALKAIVASDACGGAALPEPVAFVSPIALLLQRAVPGEPVRAALLGGDTDLAVRIADAAHALHASGTPLDRRHTLADELAILRKRVDRLRRGRARARQALTRIQTAAAAPVQWRAVPIHRDLYHDQLLHDRGRLAVLDFDDVALSEPAVDVANVLAHLRLLALEHPEQAANVDAAAEAFRDRAHALDRDLDAWLVRLLESATLLRLACIHEPLAQRLIDAAEALLPRTHPRRRHQSGPTTRLDLALDADRALAALAPAVEVHAGVRAHACRPVLLRTKKHRIVVRYELQTDKGRLNVVGKWFHAHRAAAVVQVLSALRAHGFADGAHTVPAPVLHLPEHNALFTEEVAGPSLRSVLEHSPAAAGRAGAWLARFHTSAAAFEDHHPPTAMATTIAGWGRAHEQLAPHAARIAAALRALPDPAKPVHFDYATADVFVPEDGPTAVIDFDDAALGDPAFDVANFDATLTLRAWRRGVAPEAFAAARMAFRAGYAEHAPLPPTSPVIEAAAWLRLAHRGLSRGVDPDLWGFALKRAAQAREVAA